jgi:protein-L-isoaspartate O-methyltransferase
MTGNASVADERLEALIGAMETKNYLPDPVSNWKDALRRVPRYLFVPDRAWVFRTGPQQPEHAIDKDARPVEWWNAVYLDTPIVTQADDGATDPTTGEGSASSSLSALSGVLFNFGFLDLDEGHNVLEMGTGTGYTAALTSHIVGEHGAVTTVEVDPELAKRAEANLSAALPGTESPPTLIVGDGADGHANNAPYDRVHATCSVQTIPYAWIEQTRPGGRIVTPYGAWFGYGLLAQVDVMPDGIGMGRFPGTSGYMHLRSQRPVDDHPADWVADDVRTSQSRINPRTIAYAPAVADLVVSQLVPGVTGRRPDDALWLFDGHDSGCWAIATFAEYAGAFEIKQAGERNLWDEAVAAYFRWQSLGRPELDRFGLTVTRDGERLWLDHPDNVISV